MSFVHFLGEFDGLLLHRSVGQDDHQESQPGAEPHQLDRPDGGRFVRGPHHHGRAVGQVGEQSRRPLEHQLDLAVGVVEELTDLEPAARIEGARPGEVVDEEPVALVGRDAPGTGVGLGQKTVPFEGGHVRPHGGG